MGARKKEKAEPSSLRDFASYAAIFFFFSFFFFSDFGSRPKNVPVADVWTEGVCMLFIYTLPYGTQYDHHNNQ